MNPAIPEKKISGRVVYAGKILDLFVDQVRIPDGSRHVREVVGHAPAVAIVPLLDDGQVLLVRQYRYAVRKRLWEIPAGLMNPGETPLQAARRELREETGYRAGQWLFLAKVFSSPGYCQEKIHLFLGRKLCRVGAQFLDQDEFLSVSKMPLAKALRLLEQGIIEDGKSALGLMLAHKKVTAKKNRIVHSGNT